MKQLRLEDSKQDAAAHLVAIGKLEEVEVRCGTTWRATEDTAHMREDRGICRVL